MSFPVRRIPLIGQNFARIGQVYQILAQPCQPEPSLWVQAFWTGVPKAIWSIVKPDPTDYLTERFGSVHSRKRKRRFNIDDIMETKFPVGKGWGWAAWQGTRLLERVGWYLLIADVTTEFLVNWTSTAYLWAGCRVPGAKYSQADADFRGDLPRLPGPTIYNLWSVKAVNGVSATSSAITPPTGSTYSIQFQLTAAPPVGPYPTALPSNVRLIDTSDGSQLAETTSYDHEDGTRSYYAFYHAPPLQLAVHTIAVAFTQGDGAWRATGGCFNCSAQPNQMILPDP